MGFLNGEVDVRLSLYFPTRTLSKMFTFLKGGQGSGQLSMMQHVTIWAVGVLGWAPLSGRTSQSLLGLGGDHP